MGIFEQKYKVLFHNTKKDWTGNLCVNLESNDLEYIDMMSHEGLQCNHLPESKEYKEILKYCRIINNAFKQIEKLNSI